MDKIYSCSSLLILYIRTITTPTTTVNVPKIAAAIISLFYRKMQIPGIVIRSILRKMQIPGICIFLMYNYAMRFFANLLLVLILSLVTPITWANDGLVDVPTEIREPSKQEINSSKSTNQPIKPDGVEDFAASPFKLNSSTAQIPVETRLRIRVETALSADKSSVGDDFQARVLNDFYISGDFRKLIVPKDSWIRGKVNFIKKPKLLSRSGKLGIKLDTLLSPQGDYVPLDANLVFQTGVVNDQGLLDPQTDFSDKAIEPTQALLSTGTGKVVSVATLGIPVVGTLLGGSVMALFSHGDDASVYEGQELQIVLTTNTDLSL